MRTFKLSKITTNFNNSLPSPSENIINSPNTQNSLKSAQLQESELKKQFLKSFLTEEDPIGACKKYLELLVIQKTGKDPNDLNINTAEFAKNIIVDLKQYNPIKQLEKKLNKKIDKEKNIDNNDNIENNNNHTEEEENIIKEIKKKNDQIISTSKKLKNRMKLEKIDKEQLFKTRTMKIFTNLHTFIDAKEFLEQINPFKEKDTSKNTDEKIIYSIRKLQNQAVNYFDNKIKDFVQRLDDIKDKVPLLDDEKLKNLKKLNDSCSDSSISSRNSENSNSNTNNNKKNDKTHNALYGKIHERKKLEIDINLISPKLKNRNERVDKNKVFYDELEKKKIDFKYLQHNSLFLQNNFGKNNQNIIKVFKEFYNARSRKNKKNSIVEKSNIQSEIIKQILVTDRELNQMEFEVENKNQIGDSDFYNNIINHFSKENFNNNNKAILDYKKNEKESIERLESIVKNITKSNINKKKNDESEELFKKYEDFKKKSSSILKLVSKTSKIIFNEKNKSFYDKKFVEMKDLSKLALNKNERTISKHEDKSNLYLTSVPNKKISFDGTRKRMVSCSEKPDINYKEKNHRKTISVFNLKKNNNENNERKSSVKFNLENFENMRKHAKTEIEIQKPHNFFTINEVNSAEIDSLSANRFNNTTNNNFFNKIKKRKLDFIKETNFIIDNADSLKTKYQNERKTLNFMENESDCFYRSQKKKLYPTLDSLILTLDKYKPKRILKKPKAIKYNNFKKVFLNNLN